MSISCTMAKKIYKECYTNTSNDLHSSHMIYGCHLWLFLGIFSRTYCGVRGLQRALYHEDVKAHVTCSTRYSCLALDSVLGIFWAKKGCFGV